MTTDRIIMTSNIGIIPPPVVSEPAVTLTLSGWLLSSANGGTGNAFTAFTGPNTTEKIFTLPDSSETLLYVGGDLGTPSSGTLINCTFPTLNQDTTGTATKTINLVGGNNTTLLGAIPYQSDANTTTLLIPNTTTTKKFLRETGDGINGTAPVWDTLAVNDLPTVNYVHGGTGLTVLGTALQVLRTNASATAIEWANPAITGVTSVNISGGTTGLTATGGPITSSGTLTLSGILISANGGTGNGFTKFSGPTTTEKTFTLPDSSATLLYSGGALGTPSSGTLTNCTFPTLNQDTSGTAAKATNLVGGLGGQIPYQTAINTTSLLANGNINQILMCGGTTAAPLWSTPTFPNTATSGKLLIGDGTNIVLSTPTFPNASVTTRKIIVSDGTNWTASTETYATPGASGNLLTSDGTNWISSAYTPRITAPTYSSNLTINWAVADIIRITLTGNIIITNSGAVDGQKCILELLQDGGGSRTVSFTSETRYGTSITSYTATTTPNKLDRLGFIYNGVATKYDVVAIGRGF